MAGREAGVGMGRGFLAFKGAFLREVGRVDGCFGCGDHGRGAVDAVQAASAVGEDLADLDVEDAICQR